MRYCQQTHRLARKDQLPELRSPAPWFSPYRDLAPILRRFNAETSVSAAEEQRLQREALDDEVVAGTDLHRRIAGRLTTKLLRRFRHLALYQFDICREFEAYAHATGLSSVQALNAWYEVWSVLQGLRQDIPNGIGQCPWCDRLFWKYKDGTKCDRLCGKAARIINEGLKEPLSKFLRQGVDGVRLYRQAMQQQFGDYDSKVRDYYGLVRRQMLMPVLGPIQEPIHLPATVADPHAFFTVWAYVFDEVPWILRRMLQCQSCGRIATRDDLRRRNTCSTGCRLKASRTAHTLADGCNTKL
jgi:hypothetical protein